MARVSRELREARAILDADYRLDARLKRIRWEEETLYPALEKVASGELEITVDGIAVPQKALEQGE